MKDFDIEISDNNQSVPEHFNGSVATAGVPVVITPTSTRKITSFIVVNQDKGTNANNKTDLLLVSSDGGTTYMTVKRGTSLSLSDIYITDLRIDADVNGVKYEVIVKS